MLELDLRECPSRVRDESGPRGSNGHSHLATVSDVCDSVRSHDPGDLDVHYPVPRQDGAAVDPAIAIAGEHRRYHNLSFDCGETRGIWKRTFPKPLAKQPAQLPDFSAGFLRLLSFPERLNSGMRRDVGRYARGRE
jgi:hypothetical protein